MNARCITGTGRSDREARINTLLHEHLGRALLLVPSRQYARRRRDAFIRHYDLPGIWGEPVLDIADFAGRILGGPRRLETLKRKLLVEQALLECEVEPPGAAGLESQAGLANHLLAVITQMKQSAIEPEHFAARLGSAATPLDTFVSAVYVAYQRLLKESQAFDVPGLYWAAADACRESAPEVLHGIDWVLLDGFDDFTPSELRLLRAVSERVEGVVFGLTHDDAPERSDAYAASAETLNALRDTFHLEVERATEEPSGQRHEAVSRHLFWRDQPEGLDALGDSLKLTSCADERHEAESIARAVRHAILDEGIAPEDLAVAYRGGEGPRMAAEALRRFGVPVTCSSQPTAAECATAHALLGVLDAVAAWERDPVLDILCSPWMWNDGASDLVAAFPYLVRRSQVVAGRKEWRAALGGLTRRAAGDKALATRLSNPAGAVAALQQRFESMTHWAAVFPREAAVARYARAVLEQLDALPLRAAFDSLPDPERADQVRGFEAVLLAARRLAECPVKADEKVSLRAFASQLRAALGDTGWGRAQPRHGVHCGDFASLRNRRFHTVFLAGLIEGAVPQAPPLNAIYGAEDLERLGKAGIGLDSRHRFGARERALFLGAVDTARERLALHWTVSKEDGREALPSPFVVETEELFRPAVLRGAAPTAQSLLPAPALAATDTELLSIAAASRAGSPFLQAHFPDIVHGSAVESARWAASAPGPYDGVLADPEANALLAARYNESHIFSVSQLETYLKCPFHFMQQRLLDIEESDSSEPEFTPRLRGDILHAALEALHRGFPETPLREVSEAEALAAADHALSLVFEQHAWKDAGVPEVILRAERMHLGTLLRRYVRKERAGESGAWQPTRFEWQFGRDREGHESTPPYPFDTGTQVGVLKLSGRIDRIDLNPGANTARIVDYKSGTLPSAGNIDRGIEMQLICYASALEEVLMPGTTCEEAVYLGLASGNPVKAVKPGKEEERAERLEAARHAAAAAVTGMREGRFPPLRATDKCHGCGHTRACRYQESRMTLKE
ncbi:MAG: hypothetical protein GC168_12635 [Candidatus Hydrogenedens sp.]|nr:hypothetical protein [Candidatus Hydrogenedens sp.]